MESRGFKYIVIVAVLMGVSFEWMKRQTSSQWIAAPMEAPTVISKVIGGVIQHQKPQLNFKVPSVAPKAFPGKTYTGATIAGLDAQSIPTAAAPVAAPTAKDAKAKADKKKKDDKKKKKKKKDDAAKTETAPVEGKPNENSEPLSDQAKDGAAAVQINGVAGAGAPKQDEKKASVDTEAWLDLILNDPSFANVSKLISEYQAGQITAEVFYNVITKLLLDSRPELKRYAVLALGSTPSSKSYELLVHHSAFADSAEPSKANAQNILKMYEDFVYLSILAETLVRSEDFLVLSAALDAIGVSAKNYVKAASLPQTQDNREPSADEMRTHKNQASINQRYEQLLPELKQIAAQSQNSELQNKANLTQKTVEELLQSSPPETTPVTTTAAAAP